MRNSETFCGCLSELEPGKHYTTERDLGEMRNDLILSGRVPKAKMRDWFSPWHLELRGGQFIIEDRNSGSIFVLEGAEALEPVVGRSVLIIGHLVAPHVIHVMGWRLLDAPPE